MQLRQFVPLSLSLSDCLGSDVFCPSAVAVGKSGSITKFNLGRQGEIEVSRNRSVTDC